MPREARDVADSVYKWALASGYVYQQSAQPTEQEQRLEEIAPQAGEGEVHETEEILRGREVTGVLCDDQRNVVTILTKGHLGPRIIGTALKEIEDVTITYRGDAYITRADPE